MSSPWFEKFKRDNARKQGIRDAKPRFVLCFEDAISAPRYFEAFRAHRKLTTASFMVDCDPSVTDPHSVVNYAIELRDELSGNEEFVREDGDQVWAIVDVDRHPNMNDAIQLARSKDINLAISNPCFEYWLLLHFEDCAPYVGNCSELISKHLKKHIPDYDKGKTDFSSIVENAVLASTRAEKQFQAKAEPDPVKCCPCTRIFRLIQSLPSSE